MIRRLLAPLLFLSFSFVHAETIKTDVLVVGGGPAGVAAAIQSARSKVKTLLVEPGRWLGGGMTMGGMCVLGANRNLPSGIWGEFRRNITDYYRPRLGYDTTLTSILRFEPYIGAEILKRMTDTIKNLTVKLSTSWTSIKKDGTGWQVGISVNGQAATVVAKVLIDGTENGAIAAKAGAEFIAGPKGDTEKPSSGIQTIVWIAIMKDFGRGADKTIAKPAGYDPSQYAYLKGKDIARLLREAAIPNDKYMISWAADGNNELNTKTSDAIYKQAKHRTLGLVYYLQTELGYKNLGVDDQFGTADQLPDIPWVTQSNHVKGVVRMVMDDILKPYDRESKLYRTSVAVSSAIPEGHQEQAFPAYTIPLGAIVVKDLDNMLVTDAISVTGDIGASTIDPSVQMTLGQGAGATAAYCAFFKTTTTHLRVRIIQGEILDYKGYLLPFTDIPQKDPHFRATQQVCATGLLKGIQKTHGNAMETHFEPDDLVNTEEVRPVLDEIYTRSFLWFNKEKPGAQFTLGNLLSLISDYTLTDPATLRVYLQKAWTTQFKLSGSFDLSRPVTRLEFAVLTNRYLNPFAKTVDLSGRVVN